MGLEWAAAGSLVLLVALVSGLSNLIAELRISTRFAAMTARKIDLPKIPEENRESISSLEAL